MPETPVLILASENLKLGGLLAVSLARLHRAGSVNFAAIWSNQAERSHPPLAARASRNLTEATTVQSTPGHEGIILGGVPVTDWPQLARELAIPYRQLPDVNARHVAATVTALGTTLGIACGHSQFFRKPLRLAPAKGWINCHPSLLPRHRGPFPGFWELRAGESETGVSLHRMDAAYDTGPILDQFRIPLDTNVTFSELVRRQGEACGQHAPASILEFLNGQRDFVAQPPGGSYEPAPSGEDFVIGSGMTCQAIRSFFMGMNGVAPIFVRLNGILNIIESVEGSSFGVPAPTGPVVIGPGRITYPVSDGTVTLAVRPATPADLGTSASSSNRLNAVGAP